MNKSARSAPGLNLEFCEIQRPHSNFSLIEKKFGPLTPLHRLFSQVRANKGVTATIERIGLCVEMAEEDEDLRSRDPEFIASHVHRIGFFTKKFTTHRGLASLGSKEFLGYAIVKRDKLKLRERTRVYESAVRASNHRNNYIHGAPTWTVTVGGTTQSVQAYLYAQQNGITNCCAHVAIKSAASRFPNGDISYREMNDILGIGVSRSPSDGLDCHEMVELLERSGAKCFVADYNQSTTLLDAPPFQKYVYGSIESGYPAIIFFETTTNPGMFHAIPIFGHTFNSDTWVPRAENSYFQVGSVMRYIPSESWVSMYIGHDDNWGSNYCIPRHYFQTKHPATAELKLQECVAHVICTLPKKVKVSPIKAEVIGADYLLALRPQIPNIKENIWAQRLAHFADQNLLVLRPILIDSTQYLDHLSRVRDWDYNKLSSALIDALKHLPKEKFWMVELSIPELFSANLRKVGEVLVSAERELTANRDLSGFILARLPGYLALFNGGNHNAPKFIFVPSGAASHVELYGCEEKCHQRTKARQRRGLASKP